MRFASSSAFALTLLLLVSACGSPEPDTTVVPDTTRVDLATEEARTDDILVAETRDGVQEARIIVRNDGYSPAMVELEEGVPARLVFIQEGTSRCSEQVHIPAFGIERTSLPVGEETVIEFTPDETGEFAFICGMDMLEGTLLVRS
jgi:plastocyanin domain-containing protein